MNQHQISNFPYTQESMFDQEINSRIQALWNKREEGKITAFDNKQIYWCRLVHPNHKRMILILNGRVESALKYQELFFDLFYQGYDVYSLDHRGQGLSDRLTNEQQLGHVSTYEDYILDISYVLEQFSHMEYQYRFLLAHSMGGAIATRYIQTHPHHPFHGMALTSPMFGLNIPFHLRPVILPLTRYLSRRSAEPEYAPGYTAYESKPFDNNPLTHSRIRYQWFRNLYEQYPQIKVGGPSSHWVWQSLLALQHCHRQVHKITLPTLVLQAGGDTIVNNASQNRLYQQLQRINSSSYLEVIPDAKHELLFEADQYRHQTLDKILNFFEDCTQKSQQ